MGGTEQVEAHGRCTVPAPNGLMRAFNSPRLCHATVRLQQAAEGVPLNSEGSNEVIAVATDAVGHQGNASVTVTRDTQSPEVEITSPKDSDTVHERFITVSGTASDANLYDVRVNGVTAVLDAGTFTATDVPLDFEGANTVTAVARDELGQET